MSLVQVKEFWENCDLNFAHNTLDGHLPGYEKLVKSWEKDFIKNDSTLAEKTQQVYDILHNCADKEIDTQIVETVLKTQELLKEISEDDN